MKFNVIVTIENSTGQVIPIDWGKNYDSLDVMIAVGQTLKHPIDEQFFNRLVSISIIPAE